MSFDTRLDNFDKLVYLLSTIPQYAPNEDELKVDTLRAHYNDLSAKNAAVIAAHVKMSNARSHRFDVLYKPSTGMVDLALDAKTYIKSLVGSTSERYKQVSRLAFRSIAR